MKNTICKGSPLSRIPKTYQQLVARHMPRKIHDKVGLHNAMEMIDLLAGHPLNKDQEDYLDLLSDLVEEYEEEHSPLHQKKCRDAKLSNISVMNMS